MSPQRYFFAPAIFFDRDSHLSLDYISKPCYIASHPRSLRGVSGDDPEGGAGSGVLRRRLVTVRPGRPGKSPARHYDLAARSSLNGSKPAEASATAGAGDASAAPGEKPPRWSAERRASRVMGNLHPLALDGGPLELTITPLRCV